MAETEEHVFSTTLCVSLEAQGFYFYFNGTNVLVKSLKKKKVQQNSNHLSILLILSSQQFKYNFIKGKMFKCYLLLP